MNQYLECKKENVDKDIESALINNEYFIKKIEEWKTRVIGQSIQDFINKTKHINVILLGKTGVGKSTLINAIIGKNVAPEGVFDPITTENKCYIADYLRLWDTRGIELSEQYNTNNVLSNVKSLISESEKMGPDWFIHCIWYCVNGSRVEKPEKDAINDLMNTYSDQAMPIIILHLKAVDKDESEKMKAKVDNLYKNRKIEFIPVLAREITSIKLEKFGLDEIKIATIKKFKDSIDSMSFEYVRKKVEENIEKSLEEIFYGNDFSNLSKSICNYFSKLMDFLDDKTKLIINKSVENLLLLCQKEIDYSNEILNHIYNFKNQLKKGKFNLSIKEINDMAKNVENELEIKYNKIKTDYYQKDFSSKIFKYYVNLVQKISINIINSKLKDIKNAFIAKMQKEIENSSNFKNIYKEIK